MNAYLDFAKPKLEQVAQDHPGVVRNLFAQSLALHHVPIIHAGAGRLAGPRDPDEVSRLRPDLLRYRICRLDVGELRRRGVGPGNHLGGLLLGKKLVLGNQEVGTDLEGWDFVLDLLPPDCLLSRSLRLCYAGLPPLIIQTTSLEQYTEQGPLEADFERVFRFCEVEAGAGLSHSKGHLRLDGKNPLLVSLLFGARMVRLSHWTGVFCPFQAEKRWNIAPFGRLLVMPSPVRSRRPGCLPRPS